MKSDMTPAIQKRKGRAWRRLARVLIVLVLLFIAACFVVDHYMQFRKSDEELRKIYADSHLTASIHYYKAQGRTLRYIRSGSDSLPTILFLHGSPGSISYYGRRLGDSGIAGKFFVLAVDRPGYGYSGFGDPEPSIQKQAAAIRPLLDSIEHAHHPIIVVGGSYGSSVACRLAMDYPQLVDGLVLTGPSLGRGVRRCSGSRPSFKAR